VQPRKGKAQETEKNWSEKEMKIGMKKRRAEENAFAQLIHGRLNSVGLALREWLGTGQ
jgi:hypothetical protein